jgi:S-adenosylmethionine:tRNA ribosyltransferase-isomerase
VGLGTFAPVSPEHIQTGRLHEEWFEAGRSAISAIAAYKRHRSHLVAVGTTVVRTLESIALHTGWADSLTFGKTDLFIFPPFNFRMVDHLITNFHLPGSSLMMLVEAFLQYKGAKRKLTDLYGIAVREKFRFYSFGDAMLIL